MHISLNSPINSSTPGAKGGLGTSAVAAPEVDATAPAPRDGSGKAHGHNGGHGHLRQALRQALNDLGFTPTPAPGHGADGDGAQAGAGANANVGHDMAQFMHALFQAVKAESVSAAAGDGTAPTDPRSGFATRLTALIGQVGSGSAPQALQAAFDKLAADFQAASAPATESGSTAVDGGAAMPASGPTATVPAAPDSAAMATTAAAATVAAANPDATSPPASSASATPGAAALPAAATPAAPTLQALLSRLQQDLGYSARSRWTSTATGNALNVTA
jgi:hypothetical protein